MSSFRLAEFVTQALREDMEDGDHTTLACIPEDRTGTAELKVKSDGVLAGMEVARAVFKQFDPGLRFEALKEDGEVVRQGEVAFRVSGSVRSMLSTERLTLNLMQRMSGIATVTAEYAKRIGHTKAKVLDTRKTTPGLRWFEKRAVVIGGGENHRFGLFDMILIKDNHVDACGGIPQALDSARNYLAKNGLDLEIEIEVRSLEELETALSHGGADRVMLDNFSPELTREAVSLCAGRSKLESSGGITLESIADYAEAGVDYVSVGAITHSVKSLDLSLKIVDA